MAFDFTGKRVLISGAGRGLGRALALEMSKLGADVFALSVTKANLDSLVQTDSRITPVLVDLADWDATRKVVANLGNIDMLVNNAGISFPWISFLDTPKENIEATMNVNLMAAINLSQVVCKKMQAAGKGGAVVNVSSINGLNPMRECMAYNISKAGLDMLTKQMALELGPYNIRVNSVNPQVFLTDMGKEHWGKPEKGGLLLRQIPLGRFAEVREVVEPILFLLSDHASMITGTTTPIEGGLLSNITV